MKIHHYEKSLCSQTNRHAKSGSRFQLLLKRFRKFNNYQIAENPTSTSRGLPRRQADMINQIVAFSSYLNTFSKISEISNFMKLRKLRADILQTHREVYDKSIIHVLKLR